MNQEQFNERLQSNAPSFTGADLRGIDFTNANDRIRYADLREANLIGADLVCINLREADLRGADLRGANLTGADLREAKLSETELSGANLTGADLREAKLRTAYLAETILISADLREANLTDAYLRGADLTGADLRGAFLTNANLTGADLSEANLTNANLTGANLTDTIQTYQPDYKTAYFDLIKDLRENEPEASKRCRRRIIEKFEAKNEAIICGVTVATLQKLWDGADWRNGFAERIKPTNPNK